VFCFNPAQKNREKSGFFSNFSKLKRFLWKLFPIEEYNRNLIHGINIKRHAIRLDPQPAYLELVNLPHLKKARHANPPSIELFDNFSYRTTSLKIPQFRSHKARNCKACKLTEGYQTTNRVAEQV
jgi:hypothetical protein